MNTIATQQPTTPQLPYDGTSHASPFELEQPQPVQAGTKAVNVLNHFRHDENIMAIPVINKQMQPVGLITRRATLKVFGHKYSYELNSRKNVDILMADQPLVFDIHTDMETISRAMTEREGLSAFDPALMIHDGKYCGLLSIITLLKQMTDIRIERALDSNPLSHLPGNNSINREMDSRLQQGRSFMLVYADLDHFKVFNDLYGYERGDRIIQMVANIMKEAATATDFIGHVGGDDFVMMLDPSSWQHQVEMVLNRFALESVLMYHANDRERGYIIAENRQGQTMKFALMSLSMAVVPCEAGLYDSHIAVAEVASEVKHLAKKEPGNSIVVNRRFTQPPVPTPV